MAPAFDMLGTAEMRWQEMSRLREGQPRIRRWQRMPSPRAQSGGKAADKLTF